MSIRLVGAVVWLGIQTFAATAQGAQASAVVGSIVAEDGRPVEGARVRVERSDRHEASSREGVADCTVASFIGRLEA